MEAIEIYKELEEQTVRLSKGEKKGLTIDEVLKDYVLSNIPTKEQIELSKILQQKERPEVRKILDNIRALREAIKILALMHASDNLEEFKKLSGKKKKNEKKESEYQLTDFDKFVKAVSSVPKKDLKKHRPKKEK